MRSSRARIAFLLSLLTLEGILITDPIRPWLPFSLWTFDAGSFSAAGVLAFLGLVLVGGFLPFPFPGLGPLPITYPLIGACLLLYGLPPAAGLAVCTLLAGHWLRPGGAEGDEPEAPWPATLAGLGLGLLVADLSGYVLPELLPGRAPLGTKVTLTTGLLLSAAGALGAMTARWLGSPHHRHGPSHRESLLLLAAAPAAAGLSLAAAQAVRIWALGPVALWLAAPFAAMTPLAVVLSRARRAARIERRRVEGHLEIIEAIALAIEAKDRTSARHLRNLRALARGLGARLGMSEEELARVDLAALLHDVGKLAVPEWILSKPGRLSDEEFSKMTVHSEMGAGILEAVPFARGVSPIVRHHHEHYDGTGYPDGLVGMQIPLGSRILLVVDAFDAITSERAYHRALGPREALHYIRSKAGTIFDPGVVKALVEGYEDLIASMPEAGPEAVGSGGAAAPAVSAREEGRSASPIQHVLDTIASSHMEIYSLHEIGQALGKTLDVEESLSLIAHRLGRLFHFAACAVFVCDHERRVLVPRLAAGLGADRLRKLEIPIGSGVSGWAAREGRSLIVTPQTDPILREATRSDLEAIQGDEDLKNLLSCLAAPLVAGEEIVGVIALYDLPANPYTAAEERLLSMVGRQVGPAVRGGLLHERTQEHTLTDFLTGLPNTRFMFVAMEQAMAMARDTGEPLSILLMDIDGFGMVNEEFGHPVGDRYLIGVSKTIRSQMRDCDVCIRYSGDEFVAILPGVGREEAIQVAERVRGAVEEFGVEGRAGRLVRRGVSVGHATYSLDGEDFEGMIAAAGERLSREKLKRRAREVPGARLVPFRGAKSPAGDN